MFSIECMEQVWKNKRKNWLLLKVRCQSDITPTENLAKLVKAPLKHSFDRISILIKIPLLEIFNYGYCIDCTTNKENTLFLIEYMERVWKNKRNPHPHPRELTFTESKKSEWCNIYRESTQHIMFSRGRIHNGSYPCASMTYHWENRPVSFILPSSCPCWDG